MRVLGDNRKASNGEPSRCDLSERCREAPIWYATVALDGQLEAWEHDLCSGRYRFATKADDLSRHVPVPTPGVRPVGSNEKLWIRGSGGTSCDSGRSADTGDLGTVVVQPGYASATSTPSPLGASSGWMMETASCDSELRIVCIEDR